MNGSTRFFRLSNRNWSIARERAWFITQPMTVAQFTAFVAAEGAKWKPLIESAGLAGKGSN